MSENIEKEELAEFCLLCQKSGPLGFDCGHPDDHTPIANSYWDANGEPWEDENDG